MIAEFTWPMAAVVIALIAAVTVVAGMVVDNYYKHRSP